ncbi:histone-like nucleoid-structuring protein Lsr2 [Nocardioides litoris]|uniref:histone-like nucleoid-structuring protein Lsr2 n=1 Tax=Nocardioides litoris TaxID=1926648 RepID=UPI00111D842C|nr:Lsr2 family protein [Nocardioides litoris]
MAQKVNIVLVDDIDGSEATETVAFGLDGTSYEIDLNDEHAQQLRDALAGYVGNARKVASARRGGGRKSSSSSSAAPAGGASAAEVREWARSNGYEVPERGRIPAEIREAFDAAS